MKGITPYQVEILTLMFSASKVTDRLLDFDQILGRLSWKPSKDSAQFTFRALVSKKMIEKAPRESRRGRVRVCYRLTLEGMKVLDPRITEAKTGTGKAETGTKKVETGTLDVDSGVHSFIPGVLELPEFDEILEI